METRDVAQTQYLEGSTPSASSRPSSCCSSFPDRAGGRRARAFIDPGRSSPPADPPRPAGFEIPGRRPRPRGTLWARQLQRLAGARTRPGVGASGPPRRRTEPGWSNGAARPPHAGRVEGAPVDGDRQARAKDRRRGRGEHGSRAVPDRRSHPPGLPGHSRRPARAPWPGTGPCSGEVHCATRRRRSPSRVPRARTVPVGRSASPRSPRSARGRWSGDPRARPPPPARGRVVPRVDRSREGR